MFRSALIRFETFQNSYSIPFFVPNRMSDYATIPSLSLNNDEKNDNGSMSDSSEEVETASKHILSV